MSAFGHAMMLVMMAAAAQAPPSVDLANTIDVIGRRREAEREDRPGQSVVMRPTDPSRFDARALLQRESAVTLPETGRVNASGFSMPRIRGQDARLTEIYVDDIVLQDPYSGLPLVDELDLRAFGELALHQGLSPPELPTVNPIGVLQYRPRPVTHPSFSLGGAVGRPFGTSSWLLGEGAAGGKTDELSIRSYARQHRTDGRYPYYSDNATPYNSADDETLTRTGNHRRSRQFLPILRSRTEKDDVRVLALWQASDTGVPSLGARRTGGAEEHSTSNLGALRWTRFLTSTFAVAPSEIAFSLSANEDGRWTDDPTDGVVGPRGSKRLKISTRKLGVTTVWQADAVRLATGIEGARSRVGSTTSAGQRTALERETTTAHVGATVDLPYQLTLEAKAIGRRHLDDFSRREQDDVFQAPHEERARSFSRGAGAALGWRLPLVSSYVQVATVERPPTLLEEFGDGGLIRGSPGLASESARHDEVGFRARSTTDALKGGIAVFQDRAEDRIVLVPSLGQSLRAVNLSRTLVRGVEAQGDLLLGGTHLIVGATRLFPHDVTNPKRTRRLPGIPEWVALAGIDQGLGPVRARWDARYQSQVYRDLDNAIAVPAYLIHDASLDTSLPIAPLTLQVGLSVLNVADVKRLPIQSEGPSTSRGHTSYSDIDGYPLPGRQWRLDVVTTF